MKIKNLLLCMVMLFTFMISGCSEQQQIHQKLIIQGIGVDSCENGYIITVQALDFQNPADEKEPNIKTFEITGISLVEALENISKQTSLTPVYSQNSILIIAEDVARDGINNFIDFFIRHCEARPKVKVCVTNNKASEIFKLKSGNKPIKAKNIHDLIPEELDSDVLHFVSNLRSDISDPYAAWLEIMPQGESKNIYLKGIGIFVDDILKELIEGEDALGFMILRGVSGFEACTVEADKIGEVACLINKISASNDVIIENNVPFFNINVDGEVSVFSMDKKFDAYFDESVKSLIENNISNKIDYLCSKVINKCINISSDVFNWGKILRNSNPKYFKNVESKWKKEIKACRYKINPDIKVTVTGKEPL